MWRRRATTEAGRDERTVAKARADRADTRNLGAQTTARSRGARAAEAQQALSRLTVAIHTIAVRTGSNKEGFVMYSCVPPTTRFVSAGAAADRASRSRSCAQWSATSRRKGRVAWGQLARNWAPHSTGQRHTSHGSRDTGAHLQEAHDTQEARCTLTARQGREQRQKQGRRPRRMKQGSQRSNVGM